MKRDASASAERRRETQRCAEAFEHRAGPFSLIAAAPQGWDENSFGGATDQEVRMTWTTKLVTLGVAVASGVIALRLLPTAPRHRMTRAVGDWMTKRMIGHMARVMSRLPESAPPRLVASILPKLQAQNEEIIAMLREQNKLLRQQLRRPAA